MKKSLIYCFFILMAYSVCFAKNNDCEYWTYATFNFRLNETWKVMVRKDLRFNERAFSEHQNWFYLGHERASDAVDFGVGYRLVDKKDSSGDYCRENRPYLELTFKIPLEDLKCSNRSRLEYRDFENKDDVFRYRNQLKLSSPQDLFNLPLHPFIADEIFIQESEGFNRNWIRTGIVWDVNKTLDIVFFSIFQKEKKDGRWDDQIIGGIEMSFNF